MKISSLSKYAIAIYLATSVFAGCSNGGPPSSGLAPATPQQNETLSGNHVMSADELFAMTNARGYAPRHHVNRGKSWVDPMAKRTRYLLYGSDFTNGVVDVYSYGSRKNKLMGQATGLTSHTANA